MNMLTSFSKPMLFAFSLILLCALSFTLHAQNENIWAFGNSAGIDFNTNPSKPISTSINTREGCSSICNDIGQLQFYTDGTSVWDRNDSLMPNGRDLTGIGINITASTSQGALVVPMPGNTYKYYVFSLGAWASGRVTGRLSYSILDMTLNNGLGDVLQKGILLDTLLTEHMTAVPGEDCNVWLIVVSQLNNGFKAYNIDVNGIGKEPVISRGAQEKRLTNYYEASGTIDIAPDRSKLAITQEKIVLYNFDPGSGKITHPVILDSFASPNGQQYPIFYGLCFSPDNNKLYTSLWTAPDKALLYQYDLSSGDPITMVSSKTLISDQGITAIKRAPDGKVYTVGQYDMPALNVINHPNLAGTACQFVADGFALLPGTRCAFGLPNSGIIFTPKKIYSATTDSTFCSSPRTLKAKNLSGQNYVWEDGTLGVARTVNNPGLYWLRYQVPVNSPCKYEFYVDTFKVVFGLTTKNIHTTTRDSGMCTTDTILMQASNLNNISYIWNDNSIGKQRKINQTGTYWVSYQVDSLCEHYVDSFIITYPNPAYKVSFDTDTLVCVMDTISFQNTSDIHFNHFNWSIVNQEFSTLRNPEYAFSYPGSYQVMLVGHIGDICPDTAYRTIVVDTFVPVYFLMDRNSICAGETISFYPNMENTITALFWQFGDGTEMTNTKEKTVHHAYGTSGRLPVVLTAHFRACPENSFSDSVFVYALPNVYLGTDTSLCPGSNSIPLTLKNLEPLTAITYYNLWSTGETTESIQVVHPGTYSLTVSTKPLGCSNTEFVTINKDCYIDIPNAFTPNEDGINDYFFPRQQLSKSITRFHMQVFNRWGQKVFETRQADGNGWDGTYNGVMQPSGVYIYTIDIVTNGIAETYRGNVTLIR